MHMAICLNVYTKLVLKQTDEHKEKDTRLIVCKLGNHIGRDVIVNTT